MVWLALRCVLFTPCIVKDELLVASQKLVVRNKDRVPAVLPLITPFTPPIPSWFTEMPLVSSTDRSQLSSSGPPVNLCSLGSTEPAPSMGLAWAN